jgi:hypothetical protein
VLAVLAMPPAALACGGGVSAVNVYKECLPTGGGGKPKPKHKSGGKPTSGTKPTTGAKPTGGAQPSGGGQSSTPAPPISKKAAKVIKHAGHDQKALSKLIKVTGTARLLQSNGPATAAEPTAIGSAFDLGSGPTVLLIVLAGTAVLLFATTGLRGLRQRRR